MKKLLPIFCVLLLLLSGCYSYPWLKVTRLDFSSPDLPQEFDGCKIIFVSDLHCNKFYPASEIRRVVQLINRKKPDLILLGGDYANGNHHFALDVFKELKQLKSRYGIFGALGNHENYTFNKSQILRLFQENGIKSLDNRSEWIIAPDGARLKIGGVGDYSSDRQYPEETFFDTKPDDFVILVSHNPEYFTQLGPYRDRLDLMLSGHTHGGQISLFGWWSPVLPFHTLAYQYGFHRIDGIPIYTTCGSGTQRPIRLGLRPEIVEIILHRSSPN